MLYRNDDHIFPEMHEAGDSNNSPSALVYIKCTGMSYLCCEIFWYDTLSDIGLDRCREKGVKLVFLFKIPPVMATASLGLQVCSAMYNCFLFC